jgi:hypothetical protein
MKKYLLLPLLFLLNLSVFAGYDYDGQKVFFREWHIWYQRVIEMPGVKRSEFMLIDGGASGIYGKDKKHVYINWIIIEGADPATAVHIGPEIFKDKNYVYKWSEKQLNIDANSFRKYWPDSSIYFDKYDFYDRNLARINYIFSTDHYSSRIISSDRPNTEYLYFHWEWMWDNQNIFIVPRYSDTIFHAINIRLASMSNFIPPFDCILQNSEIYCPIVVKEGDGIVSHITERNIYEYTRLHGVAIKSNYTEWFMQMLQKKIKDISDTQEKRERLRGIIQEKMLTEMKKWENGNQKKIDLLSLIFTLIN